MTLLLTMLILSQWGLAAILIWCAYHAGHAKGQIDAAREPNPERKL